MLPFSWILDLVILVICMVHDIFCIPTLLFSIIFEVFAPSITFYLISSYFYGRIIVLLLLLLFWQR